ncbi:MAG: S9 family peptidase [Gemmatimonadota bacterium]
MLARLREFPCASGIFATVALWVAVGASALAQQPAPAQEAESRGRTGPPEPPIAERRPHEITAHDQTRIDPYYWLRDDTRQDPEVLAHLKAEGAYKEAVLAQTGELRETLFQEIVGRIQQADSTAPVKDGNYWYYTRFEEEKEYPVIARKRETLQAQEEILVDGNRRAEGHDFYNLGDWAISSGENILAFAEDTVSRRQYTIRFKNLETGELYPDEITNVDPAMAWANDNKTLFYVEKHPRTLLAYRVRRHLLGTDPAIDPLVYEEEDTAFYTSVYKTRSDRFVVVHLSSTLSSEARYLPADRPEGELRVFLPREEKHEYEIEDLGERFIVRTNWQARNFRIVEVPIERSADKSAWKDVIPHREDAFVHDFQSFENFLAVGERNGGLRKIRIKPWDGGEDHLISFDEPSYAAFIETNPEQDSDRLRFLYTSLTTPWSTWQIDLVTGERTLLRREPVLGGFDPANYVTEYLHAPARDGKSIPVSLVYRKGFQRDGTDPLYQYGYGSYGFSMEPFFESPLLSLLDRGFVYAVAHIRGGQELGRAWYEDGKLLHKKNTFMDFIDVTEFLVQQGYTAPDRVFAAGGSAGGLLMGAVANMRPDLYRGIIAHVPFVDIMTTMLDEDIPLTSNEYDEWGDPRIKEYYDYMLSYSPYDQVTAQDYPAMFVTTGLWDSQVQYWEPVKWVAKLRALKTDHDPILLHVNMEAGHGGKSGRFRRHRETALEYTFILDRLGLEDPAPLQR